MRRSLKEDASNRFATDLAEVIRTRTAVSVSEFESAEAFDGDAKGILRWAEFSPDAIIAAVEKMDAWQERCETVMWLGSQGVSDFVPVLIAAVDNDDHPDVRMAAIKRLAAWPDYPGVRECFQRLVRSGRAKDLQPYPSITLRGMERDWATKLESELDGPFREDA